MDDTEMSTPLLREPGGSAAAAPSVASTLGASGASSVGAAADATECESHFTLRIPASTVHFRGSTLHVIDTDEDQVILQETRDGDGDGSKKGGGGGRRILVKRLSPATFAQRALRLGYTLITILFVGFLFVFCFQVILFLFLALPVDAGYSSKDEFSKVKPLPIISTLLSFPVMLYGMTSLMALGSAFVADTYKGGAMFRSTFAEVLYMLVFLVVPLFTYALCMMARYDEPWRMAARVWAVLVCLTFVVWSCAVTHREVSACFRLVERRFRNEGADDEAKAEDVAGGLEEGQDKRIVKEFKRLFKIAKKALVLTQTARYSGEKLQRFHVLDGADAEASASSLGHAPRETYMTVYSRFTTIPFLSEKLRVFNKLDKPKRVYSSDEIRDIIPFITRQNWSMQKMWCMGDMRHRSVVVASGPSALTSDQMKLSVFCSLASGVFATLVLVAVLVWFGMGLLVYFVVAAVAALCCLVPIVRNGLESYRMYAGGLGGLGVRDLVTLDGRDEEDGSVKNIFQVWETVRVTEPTLGYIYSRVFVEFVFFFLWPLISMLLQKNYPIAIVFLLLSSFTFLWRYFDAAAVLSELGSIAEVSSDDSHNEKYSLSEVIGRVTASKGRKVWSWVFAMLLLAMLLLLLLGNGTQGETRPEQRRRKPILLADGFYYTPQESTLAYPTCQLTKGFDLPIDVGSDLADYIFMSALAYESFETTTHLLEKWFGGPGVVVDEDEFVREYRRDSLTASSPAFWKLFSVPSVPGFAVMSIRGSETIWDWMSNLQIWSASGFSQVVHWIIPYGWLWNSILPDLVSLVNHVQSQAISEASYYRLTSRFVNDVLDGYTDSTGKSFDNVKVTGVSLGGGLAIITGAQTDAFTVAFSGMGATIARDSLDPPVLLEKINNQTFNYIPERDPIARIGGRSMFFQNGQCIQPPYRTVACHNMWSTLCDISYRCGSHGRPLPCRCVEDFGYPMPITDGNRTFIEVCQEANDEWNERIMMSTYN